MNAPIFEKKQKKSSLLPYQVIINREPSNYSFTTVSQTGNSTCEGIDCRNQAEWAIVRSAGQYGPIKLFLCSKCVTRFQEPKVENAE